VSAGVVRVAIAAGGAGWESQAVAAVEARSDLRLVRRCVDVADLLSCVSAEVGDAVMLSPSLPNLDLDVVDRIRQGGVRVVPVQEGVESKENAVRLGLGELWSVVNLDALAADMVDHDAGSTPVTRSPGGRLIAVWGPTGAPGRSSVALSLASALSARGTDTILVDADVEGGSQAQALGLLDDVSGLVAAVRSAHLGHSTSGASEHARQIAPHLRLLSGLPRADMADQVRSAGYAAVITSLLTAAEVVVVDCGFSVDTDRGGRGQIAVDTLLRADDIVVVGRVDPLGLTRLVRALHDLATVVPGRSPQVVINHSRRSLGWSRQEIDSMVQRLTGIAPHAHLPWDQSAWDAAVIAGRTPREVAPSSPFVARIEAVAATLTPVRGSGQQPV